MLCMPRHTSFRFRLDPSVEQERVLSQHVGAARFAFNQALRLHKDARSAAVRERSPKTLPDGDAVFPGIEDSRDGSGVPRTGFDLINAFNAWKVSAAAGRRLVVDPDGTTEIEVTGLVWRNQVLAQVFEEAVVDLGRALKACNDSRTGARKGPRVGFPRFKKKNPTGGSFRIRNNGVGGRARIRLGDTDDLRSVSLPKIGVLRIREDTRRLRRMIAKHHARILFVTVSRGVNRWWISITVQAADLHPALRHPSQPVEAPAKLPAEAPGQVPVTPGDTQPAPPTRRGEGWVGVDRGLHALAVAGTSNGLEMLRVDNPRAFQRGLPRLRRLSKAVSRKRRGSKNRKKAVIRLSRQHARIRDRRRHVLHQVSNQLVKNHARLVLEDLNITGMRSNRRLSRAISDVAWGELARQITYKQAWRGGQVLLADQWFPSSKTCSACGVVHKGLTLKDRIFECCECGHVMDRDLNAAVNLAAWAENHTHTVDDGVGRGVSRVGDRQAAGPVTNTHRQNTPTHHGNLGRGGEGLDDVGTRAPTAPAA
jgi:putative transposase